MFDGYTLAGILVVIIVVFMFMWLWWKIRGGLRRLNGVGHNVQRVYDKLRNNIKRRRQYDKRT